MPIVAFVVFFILSFGVTRFLRNKLAMRVRSPSPAQRGVGELMASLLAN
jgi:uncharacterized membrane protein